MIFRPKDFDVGVQSADRLYCSLFLKYEFKYVLIYQTISVCLNESPAVCCFHAAVLEIGRTFFKSKHNKANKRRTTVAVH